MNTHAAPGSAPTEQPTLVHGSPQTGRRSGAALFSSLLLILAVTSGYLVAVMAVRLDRLFFPGNEIELPQAFKAVPGLSAAVPTSPAVTGSAALGTAEVISADRITILVLGLDRRPSEGTEPTRSDSMFLLTLDPSSKSGSVLSIPRDLWVEIPEGNGKYVADRINTAYRYGGLNGYKGGAMQAARDAVEHNFPQIQIDYEVVIDFASFIKIIDRLGGIDIDITEGFRYLEPVSVDDHDGVIPVFKPGREHMNGERALYYSRFRDGPDGDLGRIRRQQQVMMAVAQKLVSADAFAHALDLWGRYKDAIETDIPSYRIPGLALLAKQVGLDKVTMRSLGEVTRSAVTAGGADVLVADPADLARVVGEVFYDPRLRQEAATVEVQNGTTRTGLARAAGTYFVQRGLREATVSVSATVPPAQDETAILVYHGKTYTAERLADWLGIPTSRVKSVRDSSVVGPDAPDIVVVLGRDARVPTATQQGAATR